MNQLRLKLKYDEISALDGWISDLLRHDDHLTNIAEMAALAVLTDWQLRKLRPKLIWVSKKPSSYTVQAPVTLALLHFIGKSDVPVTSYLGHCLHNLKNIIYTVYNNTKLIG